ncbi:MAG: EthD domain-containing protein [Verrucomicrobiota bacterium]
MIKLVMCLCRRSDMSREEFQAYWLNQHGPFFQEKSPTMRAKKYVQSHTISSPLNDGFKVSRGLIDEYDGVAEVWFESEEDLVEAMGTTEAQQLGLELLEDEENFIDHSKSAAFIVKEHAFQNS